MWTEGGGCSGDEAPRRQSAEGGHEVCCPRPALRQAQRGASCRADDDPGGVQERVAQALGLGPGEIPFEAPPLHPGEQVAGHEDDLGPRLVVGEALGGEVGEAGVLGVFDGALAASASAVEGLQEAEVLRWVVGDEDLVAVALDVGEGELGAGMGLFFAHEHPGALWP